MVTKKSEISSSLRPTAIRLARLHFWYVGLLAMQVMIYDVWKLIAPEAVMQRWVVTAFLLVVSSVVWYLAKVSKASSSVFSTIICLLVVADIIVATFSVYNQRGMASRAVALYAIPLIVAAALKNRAAVFATALISVAAYISAAVSYFVLNFNEGYKIELYGEVGFYCFIIIGLASGLWVFLRSKN